MVWQRWRQPILFCGSTTSPSSTAASKSRPPKRASAFVTRTGRDLDLIFSLQFERTVNRDNTVNFQNLGLQIEPVRWRASLAGCTVMVHQHLDGTLSMTHGPHRLGHYSAQGVAIRPTKMAARRAVAINSNRTSHVLRKPDVLTC